MSFVYPEVLWALSLLVIPVIIHFFNFRRYKTVLFSNIEFLKEVKQQSTSRNRLKDYLILLSRLLALAFLVFAFAQPFIPEKGIAVRIGNQIISIYIDNSQSMSNTGSGIPLVDLAKTKAHEILNAYQPQDQIQVLTNEFSGLQQQLVSTEQAAAWIDQTQLSSQVRTISQVVKRQLNALQNSSGQKTIYLISDFQKSTSDLQNLTNDTSVRIVFIPLSSASENNVSVDSCWFTAPAQQVGQPEKIIARIRNYGNDKVDNSRITLRINNQIKAINTFSVSAHSSFDDSLSFVATDTGWNRAEISIPDNPVIFDNQYFLTEKVNAHADVLIIHESAASPYLISVFSDKKNYFRIKDENTSQVNYADIPASNLVVLQDLTSITNGLASTLVSFIQSGGQVLIFPNKNADVNSYNAFLQSAGASQMSAWTDDERQVTSVNFKSSVFKNVFREIPENIKMPRVKGFFSIAQSAQAAAEKIMWFADGEPLVEKFSAGNGNLFICTSPLDAKVNDLPLNSLFVPMLYNIAIQQNSKWNGAYTLGNVPAIQLPQIIDNDHPLHLKNRNEETIPRTIRADSRTIIQFDNSLSGAGFYSLFSPGSDTILQLGINENRLESKLDSYSTGDLSAMKFPKNVKIFSNAALDLTHEVQTLSQGITLWKVCLIFVLLMLAIEIMLVKFWK